MGKRIYYGYLLRATKYFAEMNDSPAYFYYQVVHNYRMEGVYKAATIDELVAQLKADGHQVWHADDPLYLSTPPYNALEYILMSDWLRTRGYSDEEIAAEFSLKREDSS